MQNHEITLKPAVMFAFLKCLPLMLLGIFFFVTGLVAVTVFPFLQLCHHRYGLVPFFVYP